MMPWFLFSWWTGIVTKESSLWSKFTPTGCRQDFATLSSFWGCVSGQVLVCDWQYSGSEQNIFVQASIHLKHRHLCQEQGATGHVWWQNILDHLGLCCGPSDSAIPQLAQRWKHWVNERDLAVSSPVARWLVLPRCDDDLSSLIQVLSDCIQSCSTTVTLKARAGDRFLHTTVSKTVVFTFSQ